VESPVKFRQLAPLPQDSSAADRRGTGSGTGVGSL